MRFEQKFKDYRMAFRHFDVNFDGTVEFHEFVGGLESCGINMPYADYRLVWDLINYDCAKELNFLKFCLINMDKTNNVLDLIKKTMINSTKL
jgi:Ca2+-binding EF-hand superfamily protein